MLMFYLNASEQPFSIIGIDVMFISYFNFHFSVDLYKYSIDLVGDHVPAIIGIIKCPRYHRGDARTTRVGQGQRRPFARGLVARISSLPGLGLA